MLVLLLETIYLPRLGLTMQDLHTLGEQAEVAFADLKHFVVLYGVVVIAVLLALEDAKMMMKRKEQPGVPIVKGAKQA